MFSHAHVVMTYAVFNVVPRSITLRELHCPVYLSQHSHGYGVRWLLQQLEQDHL